MLEVEPTLSVAALLPEVAETSLSSKTLPIFRKPSQIERETLLLCWDVNRISHRLPIICRGRRYCLITGNDRNGRRWAYWFAVIETYYSWPAYT